MAGAHLPVSRQQGACRRDGREAIAAGGKPWKPTMEQGPMYGGSFQDLDGHVWELMYMAQP